MFFFFIIVIHVLFIISIYEIYFKSPLVQDVVHYKPKHEAPADRMMLFMVDGLRAESFFNHTTMPYLRSIANSHGRWGMSRTRAPTESRPGHIAAISGFYEDPSAVTKLWKDNPVAFDSVVNQTAYAWCWGDNGIVHIFTKANTNDHIFAQTFDPYSSVTFRSDRNTTLLDSWVFENVKEFFSSAAKYANISEKLQKNKIGLFLYLGGTDESGGTDKPESHKFLTTLKYLDAGIKEIEKVIRDFYGDDGKTSFLMTSDHGMTDWGSHGAGDDHEIETPYVMWGAGVKQLTGNKTDPSTNGMSLERRLDVEQADLAPLMSTILCIPVPVNSIGKLVPDLLNMTLENKAKALYSNARQLASQYDKKRADIQANIINIFHFPFKPFTGDKYTEVITFTEHLLQEKEYEKLVLLCDEIISLSLSGLDYYHKYYQRPLLFLVTLSFVGWIMYLVGLLAEQNVNATQTSEKNKNNFIRSCKTNKLCLNVLFSVLLVLAFIFVFAQSLPMFYYVYFMMPVILWWYAMSNRMSCKYTFQQLKSRGLLTVSIEIICYILGSLALGLSFTHRWMLSVPLIVMGLWPFFSKKRRYLTKINLITWSATCAALSIFTFLPVVGKKVYIDLVIIAGIIQMIPLTVYIVVALWPLHKRNMEPKREIVASAVQLPLRIICLCNIYVQSKSFEEFTTISSFYKISAWLIAVLSLVLPLLHSKRLICRLVAINAAILNFYLLLSVAHEGLFMVALMCNTSIWIYIEFKLIGKMANEQVMELMFQENDQTNTSQSLATVERCISSDDFRRAFFFMTYIVVAFFGTGNIASLNSFEVRWVACFLTSYKPFVIATLILLKTLTPLLVVACAFRAVQLSTKAPIGYLNIIVLIYSNIMGIQHLYYVKNKGSWLEIGTSISHYVIVQATTIFVVLINTIAKYLTELSVFSIKSCGEKKSVINVNSNN